MAPSRHGQACSHRVLWGLSLCLGLVSPAGVGADLYTWVDDRGIQNIVDNPTLVPERFRRQARHFIVSNPPSTTTTSPLPNSDPWSSREVEPPPAPRTQGGVAVALAERLGLAHPATPLQAASALLERGIVPPAGWMLDEPIDSAWMADLARSLLAASSAGRLLQAPETAFRALEEVAAERGIALVAVEPPPPLEPPVIVTQPETLIVERVFVPAFPLHTRHLVLRPHFGKKFFEDHPHHPIDLRRRHAAEGKIAGSPTGGSRMLTGTGSTVLRPEPLDSARGKLVEGLTTGGREKRSGATRCASSGSTVLTAGSMGRSVRTCF